MLCTTVVHNDTSVDMGVGLGLVLVFVRLFRFRILYVFWFNVDYSVPVMFAFIVLGLVSSAPCQEIGREERLRNDLFCVAWDVKPQSINCKIGMFILEGHV